MQGIEATEIIPGRCEVIDEDQPFGCVVDAADSPKALSRLMDGLQECRPKRLILVLGCPGEASKAKRPFMGEVAHYKVCAFALCESSEGCRRVQVLENLLAITLSAYYQSSIQDAGVE